MGHIFNVVELFFLYLQICSMLAHQHFRANHHLFNDLVRIQCKRVHSAHFAANYGL